MAAIRLWRRIDNAAESKLIVRSQERIESSNIDNMFAEICEHKIDAAARKAKAKSSVQIFIVKRRGAKAGKDILNAKKLPPEHNTTLLSLTICNLANVACN